jgi:hypothetical protein
LIKPRGSSLDTIVVSEVRESNSHSLKGQPMQAMASNSKVAKNKEQVALKVKHLRGSLPSSSGGMEQPSKSVQKKSWYKMTMQDDQEQEASRSMIRGNSSQTSPSEMAGIAFMSEDASN